MPLETESCLQPWLFGLQVCLPGAVLRAWHLELREPDTYPLHMAPQPGYV